MTATATQSVQLSHLPPAVGRAGLRGVIAAEFTKLRSVRSTYWTLAALVIISVGIATIAGFATLGDLHSNPGDKAGFDATQVSLIGFFELGQLVIAVLGALAITAEYSTGMIRTSLTAMPRRGVVYAGKLIVITSVTLVVSLVTSFVSFLVGQAILSGTGVSATLFGAVRIPMDVAVSQNPSGKIVTQGSTLVTSSTVLTAIIGTALVVTLVALIAFAVGAIIRHSAGAITTVIGMMFVLPIIVQILPHTWRWDIVRFLPDAAGRVISVTIGQGNEHLWSAWPQFGVTAAYAVVLLVIGGYLFRKRDA